MAARKGKAKRTPHTGPKTGNRRAIFVQEFLKDMNATQAAKRAGYSERSAHSQGARLLKDVEISRQIEAARAERAQRTALDADWVLTGLRTVAERCMQAEPVLDRKGKPTGEYRFDATGANRALELIGKHNGMFVERIGDPDGKPLQAPNVTVSFVKPRDD